MNRAPYLCKPRARCSKACCPEARWLGIRLLLAFWLFPTGALTAWSAPWDFQCTASVGGRLDSVAPQPSFTLEPKLVWNWSPAWSLKVYSLIDRPTNRFENFAMPTLDVAADYTHRLSSKILAGSFAQLSAVDVLRWNIDGWVGRAALGPWISWQWHPRFRIQVSAAPFLQFSQYALRSDGEAFSVFGLAQEVRGVFQWSRWTIEASLFFIQSRKRNWRNQYVSSQQVAYAATPELTVGVAHQLADQTVSLSTGLARPFGLFDGRLSRLSGFVRWRI